MKIETIITRALFVLCVLVFATLFIAMILLPSSFGILTRTAMWAGAVLWIFASILGWREAAKDIQKSGAVALTVTLTVIATGALLGIFIPFMRSFAVGVDVLLGVLGLLALATSFRKMRNSLPQC